MRETLNFRDRMNALMALDDPYAQTDELLEVMSGFYRGKIYRMLQKSDCVEKDLSQIPDDLFIDAEDPDLRSRAYDLAWGEVRQKCDEISETLAGMRS